MDLKEKLPVNRVASSSLITINLEKFHPKDKIYSFDLADYLFKGLVLREKDFRQSLKLHQWTIYTDGFLCVYCSADAIVPVWAYMLVASNAAPHCREIHFGDEQDFLSRHYRAALQSFDAQSLLNKKVVIKGCSNHPVPTSAYLELTALLRPYADSIMYGEPCSTVPIFKKKRTT